MRYFLAFYSAIAQFERALVVFYTKERVKFALVCFCLQSARCGGDEGDLNFFKNNSVFCFDSDALVLRNVELAAWLAL